MTTTWKAWCPDETDEDGADVYDGPITATWAASDIAVHHAKRAFVEEAFEEIAVMVSDGVTVRSFAVTVDYDPTFWAAETPRPS